MRIQNTEHRIQIYLVILIATTALLVSCGTKKKVVVDQQPVVSMPAWHTCLIQNARATVTTNTDRLSANMTMQTVHDSMLVISVMPMLGMEMLRIEATPLEVIAIDKIHGRYAKATYADINRRLTPSINWDILQQICTADIPGDEQKARLVYTFGEDMIELVISYPARQLDVPVKVNNIRLNRYTQIDISKWL
jgi:hypothetical protein